MSSKKVPEGWCPTCHKKALDQIDVSTDAEKALELLKKKMLVAFMIGDRDGALAEISYQLGITPGELSVAGPWESPALTREMARAIASEIFHKYPDVLEDLFEQKGIYHKMREKERRREVYDNEMRRQLENEMYLRRNRPTYSGPVDLITPSKREYYIPPWTSKKNER